MPREPPRQSVTAVVPADRGCRLLAQQGEDWASAPSHVSSVVSGFEALGTPVMIA